MARTIEWISRLQDEVADLKAQIARGESPSYLPSWLCDSREFPTNTPSTSRTHSPSSSMSSISSTASARDDLWKGIPPIKKAYWTELWELYADLPFLPDDITTWGNGSGNIVACVKRKVQYDGGEQGELWRFHMKWLCQYAPGFFDAIVAGPVSTDQPIRIHANKLEFDRLLELLFRIDRPCGRTWPVIDGKIQIDYTQESVTPMPEWAATITFDELRRLRRTAAAYGVEIVLQQLDDHFAAHREPRRDIKAAELQIVNEEDVWEMKWITFGSNILYSLSGGRIGSSWDWAF